MRAGPELDARLCELLEPQPEAYSIRVHETGQRLTYSTSQRGFWNWRGEWYPIAVSADWAAMGKAVAELAELDFYVGMERAVRGHSGSEWHVQLNWGIYGPDRPEARASSDEGLPHAFALVAVEALERRKANESD